MIKHALEIGIDKMVSYFEKLLKEYETIDECDYFSYTIENYLEKKDFSNLYVVLDGEDLKDLIYHSTIYGITVLSPLFIYDDLSYESTLLEMKEKFCNENVVVYVEYIPDCNWTLYPCNLQSSIEEEYTYILNHGTYSVFEENNINILRDAIEKIYFPKLDFTKDEISFQLFNGEDVSNFLLDKESYCYPMWINRSNHRNIIGFRYFQPDFYENNTLLVALCKGVIIGCIKYGRYYEGEIYQHYGLNYIEVKTPYRKKGISKKLINEMARILNDDMPLSLSRETTMGEKCEMAKHFKKANFKTRVYAYNELEKELYN